MISGLIHVLYNAAFNKAGKIPQFMCSYISALIYLVALTFHLAVDAQSFIDILHAIVHRPTTTTAAVIGKCSFSVYLRALRGYVATIPSVYSPPGTPCGESPY